MGPVSIHTEVLLARQPIYDASLKVVAYELLMQHRDGSAAADDADASGTIAEVGLSLVAGQPAYLPLTRSFLLEGFCRALPADRVVLQIGPELLVDRAAVESVQELVAAGYPLALVGYESAGALEALLPLASVVGLDLSDHDRGVLRQEVTKLRAYGVDLLARSVEDHADVELAAELGFDMLQGYFFCRPRVLPDSGVHVNKLSRMQLVSELQQPEVDLDGIQAIVGRDPALSYALLRFINSAFFSVPRRVESIRDAIALLGLVNVRKWATLMALAAVDDKPSELVVTGLVRARMCELLARAYNEPDAEGFFTTGLFSVVDALMDTSMVELLATLPLSAEIIGALLNHEGAKGRVLHAVIAYERGNFGELGELPLANVPLNDLYASAVAWAAETQGQLRAA